MTQSRPPWDLLILYLLLTGEILLFLLPGLSADTWAYLLGRRLPLVLAVILGAGAAGIGTVLFQSAARNPILTPEIMGTESLYILVQTLMVFLLPSGSPWLLNSLLSFFLSLAVLGGFSLILVSLMDREGQALHRLLITGIILSTLFTSLSNFLGRISDPQEFSLIQNRLFASVNNVDARLILPTFVIALLLVLTIHRKRKIWEVLRLGRDHSVNLGLDYRREMVWLLLFSNLLSGLSTALLGPFPFLGLLGVSLTRLFYSCGNMGRMVHRGGLTTVVLLFSSFLMLERALDLAVPIGPAFLVAGGLLFLILIFRSRSHVQLS